MKKEFVIILVSLCIALSCTKQSTTPAAYPLPVISKTDTIFVPTIDTIKLVDTMYMIPDKYLEYELIVRNIRHYVSITERNASNRTFFFGWIKRAVAE